MKNSQKLSKQTENVQRRYRGRWTQTMSDLAMILSMTLQSQSEK
jgi:hypothetical protein